MEPVAQVPSTPAPTIMFDKDKISKLLIFPAHIDNIKKHFLTRRKLVWNGVQLNFLKNIDAVYLGKSRSRIRKKIFYPKPHKNDAVRNSLQPKNFVSWSKVSWPNHNKRYSVETFLKLFDFVAAKPTAGMEGELTFELGKQLFDCLLGGVDLEIFFIIKL
jgi:hypothetical protein